MKKYVPKTTERFRAFLRVERPGKEHFGSPFSCIEVNTQRVLAIDSFDFTCSLKRQNFSFKQIIK